MTVSTIHYVQCVGLARILLFLMAVEVYTLVRSFAGRQLLLCSCAVVIAVFLLLEFLRRVPTIQLYPDATATFLVSLSVVYCWYKEQLMTKDTELAHKWGRRYSKDTEFPETCI